MTSKDEPSISLSQIEAWNRTLGEVFATPGANEAGRIMCRGLARVITSEQWWIIFFRNNETPILHDYYDADVRRDRYADGPYLVCPFYNAFLRGVEPGCYRVEDLAAYNPALFARYEPYYEEPLGPLDEIGLMFPVDAGTTALISLARVRARTTYESADIRAFATTLPVVEAITARLWSGLLESGTGDSSARALRHSWALRVFDDFGREELTEREMEINRLLLRGFSAKEIGRFLDITEGTVRNHMKQIYAKLGVTSQASLCGILIEQLLQDDSEG